MENLHPGLLSRAFCDLLFPLFPLLFSQWWGQGVCPLDLSQSEWRMATWHCQWPAAQTMNRARVEKENGGVWWEREMKSKSKLWWGTRDHWKSRGLYNCFWHAAEKKSIHGNQKYVCLLTYSTFYRLCAIACLSCWSLPSPSFGHECRAPVCLSEENTHGPSGQQPFSACTVQSRQSAHSRIDALAPPCSLAITLILLSFEVSRMHWSLAQFVLVLPVVKNTYLMESDVVYCKHRSWREKVTIKSLSALKKLSICKKTARNQIGYNNVEVKAV